MRRLALIPFALALVACGPAHSGLPATVGVTAPPVAVNTYVLGPDGRCSIGIDVSTYVLDHREGVRYEGRLRRAMRAMDESAPANPAGRVRRAHEVRAAYVKWMKNYYEVAMALTHGPYRCLSHGHPAEELSSDARIEKRAVFAAYVAALDANSASGAP